MKRIIAILLVLISFIGCVSLAAAEEVQNEEVVETEVQDARLTDEKIETVFALGIMKRNSDDNMFLAGGVSRMNFAEWIFRIMNFDRKDDSIEASSQYFDDISLHHYGAGYIMELAQGGIIHGYDDNNFKPEEKITYQEAAKILVTASGYKLYAESRGEGYYACAKNIGIFEGVSGGVNEMLTRRDAARLLYNLMFTKVPNLKISSNPQYSIDESEEFIHCVMGLDYVDGIIDAIGGVSLYDKTVADDIVSVDGVEYDTKCIFDTTHLGYSARAYIDPEDYDSIIHYAPVKTDVTELWSDDITGYEDNTYKYKNESGNDKKVRIEQDFDLVYNKYYSQDITKMVPNYGCVRLIDNNRNGKYDVVIVTDMQSLVVDKVIGENEIVFKNTDNNSQNLMLNLKDYETVSFYNADAYEAKRSAIRAGVVLTIIKNDKGVIDIYISDKTLSGTVSATLEDDDGSYVEIDANKYELLDGCYRSSWNGDVNTEVVLRLDRYGRVAGVERSYAVGWQYGYIIKIFKIDDELGERVQLKLLTESGKIERFDVREKVKINSMTINTAYEQYDMLMAEYNNLEMESAAAGVTSHTKELATTHLVKYQTNSDGLITKIDTPIRHGLFDSEKIHSAGDDSLMLRCKGNMYYEPRQKQFRAAYKSYIDLSGEIFIDGRTKIFVIPDEDNTNPEDEDYRISSMQGVGFNPNGQFVYASGYNSEKNSLICDVVVLRFEKGASADSDLMIIKKCKKTVDDDNEERLLVSGYARGQAVEYYLSTKKQAVDMNDLKKGDIILYSLVNGEMKIENIIYNSKKTGILNNSNAYAPNSTETYFNAPFRVVKGTPVKTADGCIYISFNDESMLDEILKISSIGVFEADGDEQFYSTSADNIRTSQMYGENADTIFLCTKNGQNVSAVILRK